MKKTVLYIILIFFVGVSCKKPVLDVNPDYEGVWRSECSGNECDSYYLTIRNDNSGKYYTSGQGIENVEYEGKVRIKDDVLKIGLTHRFHIDTPPAAKKDTVISYCMCSWGDTIISSWYMVIDDITYYKE